ncbi:MAG: phosphotransferase [Bacteroidales bacterium]|nr:phosphotransferase [Bacteroidales bacterium]
MEEQNFAPGFIGELKKLYAAWAGEEVISMESLPESGSVRKYYRIKGAGRMAIGVYNPDNRENTAFVYLSRHLKKHGVNVPEVYLADLAEDIYLVEDLGDMMLYNYYNANINNRESVVNLYKSVIREMPTLQANAARGLDFGVCYPRAAFDQQSMMWDLHYFKSYFLKLTGVKFYEQDLEDDFNALTKFLLQAKREYFLFRDFQSRNIMLHSGKVYFIDYQGGRKGALQYDIASLLFEAKTSLSPEIRDELLAYYIEIFSSVKGFNSKNFLKYYYGYVLIRMLQALGAYGFRGYFERKQFFLQSIPPAVKNLEWLVQHADFGVKLPQLENCFEQIIQSEISRQFELPADEFTVSVNSFSYKSGIPLDNSGNGGGFVFDCRALSNPGRYEQYKAYTGKDYPVIEFLNGQGEVQEFLNHAYAIVESSIKNYKERNFAHLMVNFGCTGGQHRSVFCAEEISSRIKQKPGVKVITRHRELEKKK